jgi:hypothetical protein
MTLKKSLENRIRGWFPKEPYLISTRFNLTTENKQPPLVIPSGYNTRAAKVAKINAIMWAGFLVFFVFLSWPIYETYNVTAFQLAVWIFAGLTVGVISGWLSTQNQLRRLAKDYKMEPNRKDIILLSAPILIFSIPSFLLIRFLFDPFTGTSILESLSISVWAVGVSGPVARVFMFRRFERSANMRLMQSWLGGGIVVIPKPPNNTSTD